MCYFITMSETGCRPQAGGHVNSTENDAVYKRGGRAVTGRCLRTSGIWRRAVPYKYLFLKIVLPRQKGCCLVKKG